MIVSIHINKTGGTSFRTGLEHYFGKRFLRDTEERPLGAPVYSWSRRVRGRLMVRLRADELVARYDVVHGHFAASKYFPLGGRAVFCTFFRDPTDRILSQYRYTLSSATRSRYSAFLARTLSPLQYASLPLHRRFYAFMTSRLPMERFAFVGITEEYDASLRLFQAMFGVAVPFHRANVNEEVPDRFTAREKAAVRATQRENHRIYDAARRRFDVLYRRWSG